MKNESAEFFIELEKKFDLTAEMQRDRRVWITIKPDRLVEVVQYIKKNDFDHLSTISATDWLEENRFEVTYHFWSYCRKNLLTIKTSIDRKNPIIESINGIFGTNAESCEREIHELFGINFKGNLDLTDLFLEDWEGTPPFRKDFNWRDYVREEDYDINNSREKIYFEE